MARRPQMIDRLAVADDGKVVTTRVPIADEGELGVPSSIAISSAASGDIIAEGVSEFLVEGDGVRDGDLLTVRFVYGRALGPRPMPDVVRERVGPILSGEVETDRSSITWNAILTAGQCVDLHMLTLQIGDALGVTGTEVRPDITFVIDRYTSAEEDRIGRMTPDQQKALALSAKATSHELIALLRLAPANVQVSALANPATPDAIVHQVASEGPLNVIVGRKGTASRANAQVQRAAGSELHRRARRARRG